MFSDPFSDGRRVQITRLSDNKISYPIYSRSGQLISEEDQRSGKLTYYIWLNGSLVAKRSTPIGAGTWSTFYEHTDALGSPVTETDAAGNVSRIERYTPYGEPTDGGYDQGPGFTGHVTDAATGLTYAQQRYYDPVIGRFLSVDPVATNPNTGASFNRYDYANDNPYRFTDPDGRAASGKPSEREDGSPRKDTSYMGKAVGDRRGDMPPNRTRDTRSGSAGYVEGRSGGGSGQALPTVAGQTAVAMDGLGAGLSKLSTQVGPVPGEIAPSASQMASDLKAGGKILRGTASVVSGLVDANDAFMPGHSATERGHGVLGLVITGISVVQPEVGLGWGIADIAAQQVEYHDSTGRLVDTGWSAVGSHAIDATETAATLFEGAGQ